MAGLSPSGAATTRARWRRSDDLDHIALEALRKEPERRYASVEQFDDDLRRYLEGRPVQAAPDSRVYRARKFLARHRAGVAAATLLIVAVAAGVSATVWQARVASRERSRAQAQFDAVRSLANAVLGDVYESVAKLPGSVPAQRVVVAHATEYLDKLASTSAGDAELGLELARGYSRLAQIEGAPGVPNLGDQAGAQKHYEKAAAVLEPLIGRSTERSVRFRLAEIYSRLGMLASDPEAKMARFRAGLALVAGAPVEVGDFAIVQLLWAGIGDLHIGANRLDEAVHASQEAVAAAQAAYALAPGDLSLALKSDGALLEHRGLPDAALAQHYKARDLDLARIQSQPERTIWKLDLSFSYGSIATDLVAKGALREAVETYREAMRLREQAAKADPADDFVVSSLARGHARMAGLLAKVSDVEGVLGSLESQLRVLRQRLDAHPERSRVWEDYGAGAFSAVRLAADVLESHPRHTQRAARRVEAMLEELRVRRTQWTASHAGSLAEDDAAFAALSKRTHALE
jgi:tetratricopeptide (TPR) repeat protein